MLKQVLNVRYVDLSYTNITADGFKGKYSKMTYVDIIHILHRYLFKVSFKSITYNVSIGLSRFGALRKLEDLNLSGCKFVSDSLLYHLAKCYVDSNTRRSFTSHLHRLSLSGCRYKYLNVH